MRRSSILWVSVTLVGSVAGCADTATNGSSVIVTDSSGIRVVEHSISTSPDQWEADFDGALALAEDPDSPLFDVGSALRLSGGRFAVADGGNQRVVLFDQNGTLLSTTGRPGEGPGEFQHLTLLARGVADSLLVWDRRARRVSVLSPAGDFVHSFSLEATDDVPFAAVAGVYSDGSLLATGFVDLGGGSPAQGRQAYSSPAYHFGADGRFLSHAGSFSTGESFYEVSERGFSVLPVPFGAEAFRVTAGSRLVVATSDRYELSFLAGDGAPTMIVRREARARQVTGGDREALIERIVSEARVGQREGLEKVLPTMETPATMPEFDEVFSDALGRIWVREYEVLGSARDWNIYDGDGLAVAVVELPLSFTPTDAGEEFVVGVVSGEFDVQSVLSVPIRK